MSVESRTMKRLTLTAVLLLVSTTLLAQAPIPRALKDAKTVYLINDGAKKDLFNDLAIELQKWGRWTLVDDVADSDLTLTIGGLKMYRGWPITIVVSHDKTPLY